MNEFWLSFAVVIPAVIIAFILAWNLFRERPRQYRDNPKRRPF